MADYCIKCGAPLKENAMFCTACGQSSAQAQPVTAQNTQPQYFASQPQAQQQHYEPQQQYEQPPQYAPQPQYSQQSPQYEQPPQFEQQQQYAPQQQYTQQQQYSPQQQYAPQQYTQQPQYTPQQYTPVPATMKKKSKAPFIIGGVAVLLVALIVVGIFTKGFGLFGNKPGAGGNEEIAEKTASSGKNPSVTSPSAPKLNEGNDNEEKSPEKNKNVDEEKQPEKNKDVDEEKQPENIQEAIEGILPEEAQIYITEDGEMQLGGDWPDNEFTRQLPNPNFDIMYALTSDNEFSTTFSNVDLGQTKAYVERIKSAGFTIDEDTEDMEVMGMTVYNFTAENAKGYKIQVYFGAGIAGLTVSK